jgi:hypothetical protein
MIHGNARGLVEWSSRDPSRERMGLMVEKHLRKACDLNDLAYRGPRLGGLGRWR